MSPIIFVNVADTVDPNDDQGRTYRQVNAEKKHRVPIGALVELRNGARLFVVKHTRDCDQEPLYSLASDMNEEGDPIAHMHWVHGYDDESLKIIRLP